MVGHRGQGTKQEPRRYRDSPKKRRKHQRQERCQYLGARRLGQGDDGGRIDEAGVLFRVLKQPRDERRGAFAPLDRRRQAVFQIQAAVNEAGDSHPVERGTVAVPVRSRSPEGECRRDEPRGRLSPSQVKGEVEEGGAQPPCDQGAQNERAQREKAVSSAHSIKHARKRLGYHGSSHPLRSRCGGRVLRRRS